jgi:hypothetical protein
MAFLSPSAMINRGRQVEKSAILSEVRKFEDSIQSFEIFLSHSYADKDIIKGVYLHLTKDLKHTVYVDWIEDKELDRSMVNAATAEQLRQRMQRCKSLLFATTENYSKSKWMPWELGFMDALTQKRVAILPVTDDKNFEGQEYLGTYFYVDEAKEANSAESVLWVNKSPKNYVEFKNWIKRGEPSEHN